MNEEIVCIFVYMREILEGSECVCVLCGAGLCVFGGSLKICFNTLLHTAKL